MNLGGRFGRRVGFRYLFSKKDSSFLSIISVISVCGVTVGVLTMVVTLSVMGGFERELKKRLFNADAHVLIEDNPDFDHEPLDNDQEFLEEIRNYSPRIMEVFAILQTEVILRAAKKVAGAVMKGADDSKMAWLKTRIVEWAPSELLDNNTDGRIYIGQEMAAGQGILAGDLITVVSPVETVGPMGSVPRLKKFLVAGLFKTGVPEQELHVVFSPKKDVESFLRQEGRVNQIEVRVDHFENAPEIAARIRQKLGDRVLARSWQELNAHLFYSLKLERITMFFILLFIVVVASFNIISALSMMVIEKRRSLSILRAIGATPNQIGSIFLWEGITIGFVGIGGGISLGLAVCWALSNFPIIQLPDYFYDRSLPIVIEPFTIAVICLATLFIVLLGAWLPAKKATALSPISGIRQG